MIGVFQTLAQHRIDLIQFDSSMEAGPQPCYNPAHQHPPGIGGNWQTLAWIDLIQESQNAVAGANTNAALTAEEPAEVYLPYLAVHSRSAVDQYEQGSQFMTYAEPVPLFQYVYHDSILVDDFFGPPSLDGSFFRLAAARDLTWGQIPDYQIPVGYTPALESMAEAFLKNIISARTTYAKKFLTDGIMLAAPQLKVASTPVSWVTNFSTNATAAGSYASIQASAWRASDGTIGIVMTNIAPSSLTFSLPASYARFGLPSGAAYTVQSTTGSAVTTLDANMVADSAYSLTLAPLDIMLVTLTPKARQPQISVGGIVIHATTSTTVAPASIFDIYGSDFASNAMTPSAGVTVLPVVLGVTQVLVNGIPAPLFYAGPNQIVAQIPGSIISGTASVVVVNGGAASSPVAIAVQQAAPAILTYGSNRAIVQNQDFSLNSSTNPSQVGSYAVAYLVGSGPVNPIIPDGETASGASLSREALSTTVTVGGIQAQVLFAGMTPGFVGLVQINFQVPALNTGDYPIQVFIGDVRSNAATMTVAQSSLGPN